MELEPALYRFACPHCGKILKAPLTWAGRRGICPACEQTVSFPASRLATAGSWTARQIMQIVTPHDGPCDQATLDHAAMLLAQGTCLEYAMARDTLPVGGLSVRQWRRLLIVAARREALRLSVITQLDQPLFPDDTLPDDLPSSPDTSAPGDTFDDAYLAPAPDAWKIIARYLHHRRHGTCPGCRENLTGLDCLYQSFDRFAQQAAWPPERLAKWELACHHLLGLAQGAAAPPPG